MASCSFVLKLVHNSYTSVILSNGNLIKSQLLITDLGMEGEGRPQRKEGRREGWKGKGESKSNHLLPPQCPCKHMPQSLAYHIKKTHRKTCTTNTLVSIKVHLLEKRYFIVTIVITVLL